MNGSRIPDPGFNDWLELANINAEAPVELAGLHVGVNGKTHSDHGAGRDRSGSHGPALL